MEAPSNISNAAKLVSAFGEWPPFGDAEVVSFSIERAVPVEERNTIARLVVHLRKYLEPHTQPPVLEVSALATFVFAGARDIELSGFNHQNVIDSFQVHDEPEGPESTYRVVIESCWGFGGTLKCASVAVEAVEVTK